MRKYIFKSQKALLSRHFNVVNINLFESKQSCQIGRVKNLLILFAEYTQIAGILYSRCMYSDLIAMLRTKNPRLVRD